MTENRTFASNSFDRFGTSRPQQVRYSGRAADSMRRTSLSSFTLWKASPIFSLDSLHSFDT